MHQVTIIGIAGGTGSGKTTLAIALCKKYPDQCALVHLDDYFKKSSEVPKLFGFTNWEDPQALRFDDLYHDLLSLSHGKPITLLTKSELYNPHYDYQLRNRIEYTIYPKPVILVEGYMTFYDERIRNMFDLKIFLDMSVAESAKRRSHTKAPLDRDYLEKIIIPFHQKVVVPTKQFADMVIDVSEKSIDDVFQIVEAKTMPYLA